jgi:ribosomal protein L7/L12
MSRIFISYRRDDSADVSGRIYDRLAAKYGKDAIFKDVDSIPFGVNFKTHLESVVQQCTVQLVVIGKEWLYITDGQGNRRLNDPHDFVRIEIEAALRRGIPVIPLLVMGASMPGASDLPSSLVELTFRNGTAVRRDPDFHRDMDRVIQGIEEWLSTPPSVSSPSQDDVGLIDEDTFDVILSDPGPKKIDVIKVVRALTNLGLKEAKEIVERTPRTIMVSLQKDAAEDAKRQLEASGAVAMITPPSASDLSQDDADLVDEATFDVILQELGSKKIDVIKVVRALTGLGLKEAIDLVGGTPRTVLVSLQKDAAEDAKRQLEASGAVANISKRGKRVLQ